MPCQQWGIQLNCKPCLSQPFCKSCFYKELEYHLCAWPNLESWTQICLEKWQENLQCEKNGSCLFLLEIPLLVRGRKKWLLVTTYWSALPASRGSGPMMCNISAGSNVIQFHWHQRHQVQTSPLLRTPIFPHSQDCKASWNWLLIIYDWTWFNLNYSLHCSIHAGQKWQTWPVYLWKTCHAEVHLAFNACDCVFSTHNQNNKIFFLLDAHIVIGVGCVPSLSSPAQTPMHLYIL